MPAGFFGYYWKIVLCLLLGTEARVVGFYPATFISPPVLGVVRGQEGENMRVSAAAFASAVFLICKHFY